MSKILNTVSHKKIPRYKKSFEEIYFYYKNLKKMTRIRYVRCHTIGNESK